MATSCHHRPRFSLLMMLLLFLLLTPISMASKVWDSSEMTTPAIKLPYEATPPWPPCATICFEQAASEITPSLISLQQLCIASHNASVVQDVQTCLLSQCSPADTLGTIRALSQICKWPARSRRASLVALFAIQVPAVICLALRLYGRLMLAARFAVDDYLVMVLTPVFVTFLVAGQYAAAIGFGVDIWTLPPDRIVEAMRAFYIDEMLYLVILAMIKLSILFLYLRLFKPQALPTTRAARRYRKHYSYFRTAVLVIAAFIVLPSLAFLFLDIFQCRPVDTVWTRWTSSASPLDSAGTSSSFSCLNVRVLAYIAASFSIAQDAAILIAPWPLLLLLRKSLVATSSSASSSSTAAAVTALAMFSLGVFVLVTSCIRLHFLVHFNEASMNPTWDNTNSLIWSGLEVSVSVIVMSLPTIRMMSQKAWRSWRAGQERGREGFW